MGLEPGSLVPLGTTNEMAAAGPSRNAALSAAEDLYRSADTLSYGDSKPSEEAVDRVVGKINKEWVLACQLHEHGRKLTSVSLVLGASARSRTTTATSRTSTRRTRCSTRRLQSTLTSTPGTSAPTSSAGRRCKPRAVTTVMIECIMYFRAGVQLCPDHKARTNGRTGWLTTVRPTSTPPPTVQPSYSSSSCSTLPRATRGCRAV